MYVDLSILFSVIASATTSSWDDFFETHRLVNDFSSTAVCAVAHKVPVVVHEVLVV